MRTSSLRTLVLLLGTLLLTACSGTPPSGSPGHPPATDSTQADRPLARIEETTDSLATLPRSQFYRSPAPVQARLDQRFPPTLEMQGHALSTDPPGQLPSRVDVEAVGGIEADSARRGLRLHSVYPADSPSLRALPFIDLFGKRLMMRRGQAWRTLRRDGDSLYVERFVPLSAKDIQRLARVDKMRLVLNWTRYRLPNTFRAHLHALYAATPDSLVSSPASVQDRLTVFHAPDTLPNVKGGLSSLHDKLEYPDTARKRGIEGWVHVGLLVQSDGSPSHLQIVRPAHPLLNTAALRAVQRTRFEPGTHAGHPVPVWVSMPITFFQSR